MMSRNLRNEHSKIVGKNKSPMKINVTLKIRQKKSGIEITPIVKCLIGSFKAPKDFDYKKDLVKGLLINFHCENIVEQMTPMVTTEFAKLPKS